VKIILIEDNPDHVLFTQRILKQVDEKFQIDAVREGREALVKISESAYDLVICDYRLPDLTGLEILRKIREIGRDLPFIVVTSAGSEKVAVELMKEGAYDYVVKDSTYQDTLPIVIQRAIERCYANKEKKRLEKELQQSNEKLKEMYAIKSDFTSMVSHELRTPLTAIKEAIAIVLDGSVGETNADQKEFLNMAKSNIDRLKRLIDDVLDFSKLESRRLKFKMQDADINLIVKEVTASQKSVVEERKLYLNSELQATIPKVKLDPDRISQVLYNLIGNAIKFTKSGGVTVSTRDVLQGGEDVIEVCIKDTGEGIRKEDLSKLFQKFQQLGDANQRKTGGTGLGLAISRDIVEQHGGSIWVESEYGKGSEFKFTIPVKVSLKVLIIDDEKIVLDLCEKVLKSDGFLVLRSEEGAKGIDIIQTDRPDLIVLDIRLKDTNGYDVIASVKNDKNTATTPILVMSGYAEEIEKIKDKKEELALSWISKPFDNQEFLSKIKSSLEKHV